MGWQVVNQVVLHAGNTIINPNGTFVYSAAPASGNLIASIAPAAGTDPYGNAYPTGITSYTSVAGTFFAASLNGGSVIYQASTAGAGGPYTQFASVGFGFAGSTGHLIFSGTDGTLSASGLKMIAGSLSSDSGRVTSDGLGNLTVTGSLSVGGSTSTSTTGLPNGTISGTSGGASAGTAHTHGGGSYAVTNGQHSHVL